MAPDEQAHFGHPHGEDGKMRYDIDFELCGHPQAESMVHDAVHRFACHGPDSCLSHDQLVGIPKHVGELLSN